MSDDRLDHAVRFAKAISLTPRKFIYFVQCQEFTKIGITENVVQRMQTLRVSNPFPVKLLASFRTTRAKADEALLHTLFESYHTNGEWFKLPPKMREWLRTSRRKLSAELIVDEGVRNLLD